MSIIKIENLIKRYGSKLAVDNLSLNIEEREIFGLLGPNGAGKSTTIKIITGLLGLNSGSVKVGGFDLNDKASRINAKRIMGLVPQDLAIYSNMSARDNVLFFGRLYGLKGKELKDRTEEALEFVGLKDREHEKSKKFSGGMKRRLNIACAIVHQPKIIILDEPTVGIDPQSRNHILESIKELNRRGSTIIYTSHYMEEAESLCHRVGIIDNGKLIALGTKQELKNILAEDEKLLLKINTPSFNAKDEIKKMRGIKSAAFKDDVLEIITTNGQQQLQDILFTLAKHDVKVKSFNIIEPDLESLFLSLTGKNLRD
ncbi:MAG: antibiotic transporter ATP-binding protein [Clostridiales bacterium]|jgi:ABC-2 type transport system ATP-binding protein|nr:antibiotic transporter ATP-binding protein [Clostridiales bacterium]